MEGVINIFKNTGMTSFDVVRKIKKAFKKQEKWATQVL